MSEALEPLIADGVIEAVLGQLKSGKEAEVWLVQHAGHVVAAKVYKERHQRNFANNAGYKEGRDVRNSRTRRAMAKGSKFGQAASEEAWKFAEADTLFKLHALGVRVPTPVMFYEGVLLMELVVDASGAPAPRLVEGPHMTPEVARALYFDLRAQAVLMLSADLIHGDLSAYNILAADRGAVLIDFPQTVAAARNSNAEPYFRRDLDSVRNFLAGYDGALHAFAGDTKDIWTAYVRRDLTPDYVPSGPPRGQVPPPRPPTKARVEQPAPVRAQVGAAGPKIDSAEAELRELEALVLRQGGGSRPKPPGAGAGKNAMPVGNKRRRRGPPGGGKPAPANGAQVQGRPGQQPGPHRGGGKPGIAGGGPAQGRPGQAQAGRPGQGAQAHGRGGPQNGRGGQPPQGDKAQHGAQPHGRGGQQHGGGPAQEGPAHGRAGQQHGGRPGQEGQAHGRGGQQHGGKPAQGAQQHGRGGQQHGGRPAQGAQQHGRGGQQHGGRAAQDAQAHGRGGQQHGGKPAQSSQAHGRAQQPQHGAHRGEGHGRNTVQADRPKHGTERHRPNEKRPAAAPQVSYVTRPGRR